MNNQPPPRKSKNLNRYGEERQLPSMATPRNPEPANKMGFMGILFVIGVFGGMAWLVMVVFGWGPYQREPAQISENATPTATELVIIPQEQTYTPTVAQTRTLAPSLTPVDEQVPTPEVFPFVLDGEPEPVPSVMIRPKLGCEWLLIAGQVWDLQGDPIKGLTVHLYGEIDGFLVDQYVLTGAEDAIAYGESGYEIALEGVVVNSENSLQIQLLDSDGLPLSNTYTLQTFNDCQRNLILVNFKQVR